MEQVVDHLAELTGLRDRDVLDVTLVGALRDVLRPESAAVYRVVGDEDPRWITRARLRAGDVSAVADSHWAELDTLPPLDSAPARADCLRRQVELTVAGSPTLTCFPLSTELGAVGVLELHTEHPLDSQAMRMVGSILRIYRNFQGLLDYSERDTLTGLLNRKTFDESLLRAVAQSPAIGPTQGAADRRQAGDGAGGSLGWLGVIDIDHFKRVNDGHGHLIGDEVLLLMSRLMRSCFRHHDLLYRFGGEEFVVLLRCADARDALAAFDRLRTVVERYPFPQVGRITVSVGIDALRPNDSPSSAFERADRAVYWVKQNGRNGVASHADLIARGLLAETGSGQSDVELF